MTDLTSLIQLGFAGAIAGYLVIFLVKDVKKSQSKILDILEVVVRAVERKKK